MVNQVSIVRVGRAPVAVVAIAAVAGVTAGMFQLHSNQLKLKMQFSFLYMCWNEMVDRNPVINWVLFLNLLNLFGWTGMSDDQIAINCKVDELKSKEKIYTKFFRGAFDAIL